MYTVSFRAELLETDSLISQMGELVLKLLLLTGHKGILKLQKKEVAVLYMEMLLGKLSRKSRMGRNPVLTCSVPQAKKENAISWFFKNGSNANKQIKQLKE